MPKLSPLRAAMSSDLGENEAPDRVPLCRIQDSDSANTPRANRAKRFNPLSENENAGAEKRSLFKSNKFGWPQKQQQEEQVVDHVHDQSNSNTPSRIPRNTSDQGGHQSLQMVNKHSGVSQYSTPRASKIDHKHWQMLSEPGNNSAAQNTSSNNTTPKKGVSRSLKYNHETSIVRAVKPSRPVDSVPGHFDLIGDSSFWDDHNVQVLIRIRPSSQAEAGQGRSLRQDTAHSLTWVGPPESRFTFDHVACETISQEKLFTVAGLPMVENCISGYNNCMFAYGQTGSGKTHTMMGDIAELDQKHSEERGMIPRVFEYLFEKIQKEEEKRTYENLKFVCKCSFLEIYNEQITDLLEPSSTNLQIREDFKKGVYVENLTEVEVKGVQEVVKLLLQGAASRKVASTNMNRESSRSHSVFTCTVESQWERDSVINTRFGRLNLVDLAGSERQKSSGAEGDRLKEAANINKSLSTLGLVIMVLVDAANGKPRHVPYRDSKLTFLLQDSLGGNSKTLIVATISPSNSCALETLSTLKFAQRAKFIQNNAVVNEDTFGDVVALRKQIQQLKEELNYYRNRNPVRQSGEIETVESSLLGKLGQEVLAGSLRREATAESTIKSMAVEMEQLYKLVKQREEDTQRIKMVLRFREDKIRRMDAISEGLVSMDEFAQEERNALLDEIKILRSRVDHNPEVTRFAMENIRLMHELQRLQELTAISEQETLSAELCNLRDQLLVLLDATPTRENHAEVLRENEKLRSEASKYKAAAEVHRDENEKLNRKVQLLEEQAINQQNENRDLKHELDLNLMKVQNLEVDQEAHLDMISGLQHLLHESEKTKAAEESKSLELQKQLSESLDRIEKLDASLKEEKEVLEQMESQSLFLMKELESVLEQQQNGTVLKEQLQSLQLESQKRDELRCLEKEYEGSHSAETVKVEKLAAKLHKTRKELKEAQELNNIFIEEQARKLALEKQLDATRSQVESEAAETIGSMQRDLQLVTEAASEQETLAKKHILRLSDEVNRLEDENSRLRKEKDEWELAERQLVEYLGEGYAVLTAATEELESSSPMAVSGYVVSTMAEKQRAILNLQEKLQEAFVVVGELHEKQKQATDADEQEIRQLKELLDMQSAEIRTLQSDLRKNEFKAKFAADESAWTQAATVDMLVGVEQEAEKIQQLLGGPLESFFSEAVSGSIDFKAEVWKLFDDVRTDMLLLQENFVTATRSQVDDITRDLVATRSALRQVQAALVQSEEETLALKSELASTRTLFEFARTKSASDVNDLESRLKVVEEEAEAERNKSGSSEQLKRDLEVAESALRQTDTALLESAAEMSVLQSKLKLVEQEAEAERLNFEKAIQDTERLQKDFEATEFALRRTETTLFESESEKSVLASELASAKAAFIKSSSDLNDLQSKLRLLEQETEVERINLDHAIQDAEDRLSKSETELRRDLEAAQNAVRQAETTLLRSEDQASVLKSELASTKSALELAVAASTKSSDDLDDLKSQFKLVEQEAEAERVKFEKALLDAEAKRSESENANVSQLLELRRDLVDIEGALRQAETSLRLSEEKTAVLTTQLASAKFALETSTAAHTKSMNDLESKLSLLEEQVEADIQGAEERLSHSEKELRSDLGAVQRALCQAETAFRQSEEQSSFLRSELASTKSALEFAMTASTTDLNDLEMERINLQKALQDAEDKLAESESIREDRLFQMRRDLEAAQTALQLLKTTLLQSEEQSSILTAELTSTKSALESSAAAKTKSAADINVLQLKLKSLEEQAETERMSLEEELTSTKSALESSVAAQTKSAAEINDLQLRLKSLEEQAETERISLEEELTSTKSALESSVVAQAKSAADINDLQLKLTSLEEQAETERISLAKAVQDAEETLSQTESKYAEVVQELKASENRYQVVEGDCMAAVAEMNELEVKLQRLDGHVAENAVLRKEKESLEGKLEAVQRALTEAENKLREKLDGQESLNELEQMKCNLEAELEEKQRIIESLDQELLEMSSLVEHRIADSKKELNHVARERDQLHADLLVMTEQLDMAQALADERELVATEARQVAEVSKAHAEEKEEEVKGLERSVGELESTINALENQVGIVKREAQMHRLLREDLEMELQALRHELSMKDSTTEDSVEEEDTRLSLKEEVARLAEDCSEKDDQIQSLKKHICDLMTASTRQSTQYQQKITELETCMEQAKHAKPKSSSPFKCIGKGLSQQMNSEYDEDFSAARRRIGELESTVVAKQAEIHMLNTKLAAAESMTHDVVRDLLGVKMDIASMQRTKAETVPSKTKETENELHKQLEEFMSERESLNEESKRRQAELVAVRVSADSLRQRDQSLSTENEKLKEENSLIKQQKRELENEVKKLSGQQNLQQRIHHHAKIKEENNSLKQRNEELLAKVRRIEARFNRVTEELGRYRAAQGKTQSPNFDEEEDLQSKLQEAENDKLQLADKLTTLCTKIMQATGESRPDSEMDPSVALASLQNLESQLTDLRKLKSIPQGLVNPRDMPPIFVGWL